MQAAQLGPAAMRDAAGAETGKSRPTNLSQANLENAKLTNAVLTDAILTDANVKGTLLDKKTSETIE